MGEGAPRLDGIEFGVLALGDTAYGEFCATGRKIDERLAALAASTGPASATAAGLAGIPSRQSHVPGEVAGPPPADWVDNNGKGIYFDGIDNSAYVTGRAQHPVRYRSGRSRARSRPA
jgi:Flavodoxin